MISAFVQALQFYTCLSLTDRLASAVELRRSVWFYPIVGALIGGTGAVVFGLVLMLWAPPVAVVAGLSTLVLVSGALHEDALADCADGFGAGHSREERLRILKDSRVGAFGITALVLVFLFRYSALNGLSPKQVVEALVLGGAVSRWVPLALSACFSPVSSEGLGAQLSRWMRPFIGMVTGILMGSLIYLIFDLRGLLILLAALLAALLFGVYCQRKLGGLNGDCLGAAVVLAELTVYLSFSMT